MSMKIMDMQVLVQKTTDVAKVQHVQNQESNLRQQEMANQIVSQTQQNTHNVNQPLSSQSKLVHEKEEKDEKTKKNRRKKGNQTQEENTEESKNLDPNRGKKLDIMA